MVAQPEDRPGITFRDGTHESELTPIETVIRIVGESFEEIPEDEWQQIEPHLRQVVEETAAEPPSGPPL